jgi:hypothetical protein
MSHYLIGELERYGVVVRDRSEIAELHGTEGALEAATLASGESIPFLFLFLFLGARPCTEWSLVQPPGLMTAGPRSSENDAQTRLTDLLGHTVMTTLPRARPALR